MRHRTLSFVCRGSRLRGAAKPVGAFVLVGLLGGVLAGCNTSSPAAIVNGQVITQSEVNRYLEAWAGSPGYVQGYDTAAEEQYEEQVQAAQQQGQSAESVNPPSLVPGAGTGPDVYGMGWTTTEIRLLITQLAVKEYLVRHHESPSPLQLAASWASQYAADPLVWLQITAQARSGAAEWDADHALIDPKPSSPKTDKAFYQEERSYFWSQVCVSTVDISVGSNGHVDMAASRKEAIAVANELSGRKSSGAAPVTSGARYCLTPEQSVEQPAAFRELVGVLPAGQASELPESFGYEVVKVTSRTTIPDNSEVASVIDIVAVRGESQATDAKLSSILSATKVEVNPAYPGV